MIILYARIGRRLTQETWERRFHRMPRRIQSGIGRYLRWQDRQAGLYGKLLLADGLTRCGHSPQLLENLVWDAAGRPFLNCDLDFNISHSGDYVVCALATSARVGVDIEEIRPLDISDIKEQMSQNQWEAIMASENRLEAFFNLWTQKEAVAKADGRGITAPLAEIDIDAGRAFLEDDIWKVDEVRIAGGYCCHLAHTPLNQSLYIEQMFYE
jgi:4'-phosphopantetheinyl transferase